MTEVAVLATAHPASGGSLVSTAAQAARDAALDPKLVSAAHQFEASLMAELLKPLTSGGDFAQDEEPDGLGGLTSSADGSGGALMSFSADALAKALSDKGGLGIARRVLDHFEATPEAAAKTAKRPRRA